MVMVMGLLVDFALVSLGACIGVVVMGIIVAGSNSDRPHSRSWDA